MLKSPLLEDDVESAPRDPLMVSATTRRCRRPVSVTLGLVLALGVALAVAGSGYAAYNYTGGFALWYGEAAKPASASFAGYPGSGLDLATGQGRAPVVSVAGQTHECRIDDDAVIKISESLKCSPLRGKNFPERRSYVFTAYSEYDSQVNRWRSAGSGVGGFFVWTDDVREVYRDYFAADLAVAVVQQEHAFAQLDMTAAEKERKLTDKAIQAIDSLGGQPTDEQKQEFIRNYGTSYVTSVKLGGIVEARVFLNKAVFDTLSKEDVAAQVEKDFERDLRIDTSHVLNEVYRKNRAGKSIMFWGGQPDLSEQEKTLATWLATVPVNPAALQFESAELNPLVEDSKVPTVRTTVNEYLNVWADCRNKGCLSHGVCSVVGTCECDAGFYGPSCQVIGKNRGDFKSVTIDEIKHLVGHADWVVADINGDGKSDLVNYNSPKAKIEAEMALGDNRFKHITTTNVKGSVVAKQAVWVMDVNADGNDDLVGMGKETQLISYVSAGDGSFKVALGTVDKPVCPTRWLNRKLKPPLVTYCGALEFRSFTPVSGEKWTPAVAVHESIQSFKAETTVSGDFNGDGNMDLFGHDPTTATMLTMFGMGNGTFIPQRMTAPHSGFSDNPVVSDVNGDGKDDIVFVLKSPTLTTFISRGDGSYDIHMYPSKVAKADIAQCVGGDFDNDKKGDVMCASTDNVSVHTFYSDGGGQYQYKNYGFTVQNNAHNFLKKKLSPGRFNGPTNADGVAYIYNVKGKQSANFVL